MSAFDLYLFSNEPQLVTATTVAGMDGFVIDWERRGKADRQSGADTQIGTDTPADLDVVRAATPARVLCRLNRVGSWTPEEVDEAVRGGADEVLVPMATSPGEVESVLELADGRCQVGMLVETEEAVERAGELGRLPISRVFFGLNDFAICRGAESIFEAVADGTVESARSAFDVPFGFGGVTLPDRGAPVPARLLMAEMERLGCSFGFLRRSYRRDVPPDGPHDRAIAEIRSTLEALGGRDADERERDHELLVRAIGGVVEAPVPR